MSEFNSKKDFEISIKESLMKLEEFQTMYDNLEEEKDKELFMSEFNSMSSKWQVIYDNIRKGFEDPAVQKELLEKLKNTKRKS